MKNLYIVLSLLIVQSVTAHDHATAQYLGNEGVLIEQDSTKILFDAFYRNGYGNYVLVSDDTNAAMLAGTPPFDGVSAVFVSHAHGDHFSVEPTIAYLQAQSQVTLFASEQVKKALAKQLNDENHPLLARVISFDLKPGDQPKTLTHGKLDIGVVPIAHAGGERMASIRNLAFRVSLSKNTTVMHLGDADSSDAHFAPYQQFWDERTLHTAFPPYWFYSNDDGRSVLANRLKARQVIGIHVPAKAVGQGNKFRQQLGGDLFTDPGEVRKLAREPNVELVPSE